MGSWHWRPPSSFLPNTVYESGSTPLHPRAAAIARLAQAADGLHPAEGLLDLLADPLTDGVTRMPHGARVECGAAPPPWLRATCGVTVSARQPATNSLVS